MLSGPADIPDLLLWLDAAQGVTGGTSVTAWEDQSGNGYDLSATSGQEPELIASALNSLPAISSYGLPAKMSTAGNLPDISAGATVFLVAKQSEADGATNFDAGGAFFGAGSAVNVQLVRNNSTSVKGGIDTVTLAVSDIMADDTFVTITMRYGGIDNTIAINDGAETTQAANGTGYIATPLTLFKTLSAPQGNKQIAEMLIYSRALTSGEISFVLAYLKTKFNHY